MLAAFLERGVVSVGKRARPQRAKGFALIRMLRAGICNTDLELQRGYYGFSGVPGHEFVGEVVETDTPRLIGKRVVGEINVACERCDWCARSLERHCPNRRVLGIVNYPGAFAEFLTLPERNLRVVPRAVSNEEAVFVEPLAAACEILDQVAIPKGERVALLGDGKLGLLIAQVLHAHGAEVHHYGKHRKKLRISETAGVKVQCNRKPPKAAYDWVVDATGSDGGLPLAIQTARPRGTVILKSTVHGLAQIDTAPVIVNELTLVGSRCGRFERALQLLRTGKVQVRPLISEVLPLQEAAVAFDRAAQPGVLKVLLAG